MNRPRSLAFSHRAATFGSSADSKALTACAGPLFKVRPLSFCSLIALCLAAVWPSAAHACTPGAQQSCPPPPGCTFAAHQECIDYVPPSWGPCDCDPGIPIHHYTYNGTSCGCVDGQWDAPRGSLVLINSGASEIRPILNAVNETFSHEMVVQGPGSASQSEYSGPSTTSDCDHPINISSLQLGFPGMEKSMPSGAIYADIYGNNDPIFNLYGFGSNAVIWMLGDPVRGEAIASALDSRPWVDTVVHPGETIDRVLHNGAVSPYGLYQYLNIEGTYLGEGGTSLNNASMSASFCAYAYALGGPAMTPYDYFHNETVNAANNVWSAVYNKCTNNWPWWAMFFGCPSSIGCNNAAAMVTNCFVTGDCSQNNNFFWQSALTPSNSHAHTISPDYLGGLGRYINVVPRPTSWATDTTHVLNWNSAGMSCGCFD